MTFPRYPEYKDSGVEWLGEVPAHWEVKPLKRAIAAVESGTSVNAADVPAAQGELGVLKTSCVYKGWFDWRENKTVNQKDLGRVSCPLRNNTLIVSRMNTPELVGSAGLVLEAPVGIFLPDRLWQVSLQERSSPKYYYYFTRSPVYRDQVKIACAGTSSSMQNLGQDEFKAIWHPSPPLQEQQVIAAFLDYETARIDALVEQQKRLIELLKEKRQSVISHAVTKGLDPDVPMKDSEVEWLGEVPEHWDVVPTGYRYEIQLGRMLNETRSSGENLKPYLRVFDVQWGFINTQDLPLMDFPPSAQQTYRLEPGDLMVNEGGSYVGRSAIWRGELSECYYQKALHRLRPRLHALDTADFFLYVMEMATQKGVFVANANQTTIDHLTAEQLRRHRFAFPPLVEQKDVARYLEESTIKLERLTIEAQGLITLLQERRSALISAAVTGKIDVRGWQSNQQPVQVLIAAEERATYG